MKKCFVIMPYGSNDERLQRHYAGVYQSIIVPAATKAGYAVKRSDIAAEPGNITQDIIRDLADSDMVIADLTAANANVFFELGVRHTMRKSGTVHIIDQSHSMPFDIREYRAISYSTELADLPAVIDQVVAAIRKREEQSNRSDNPVHDALPGLPVDIRITGDEALRTQVRELQTNISALQSEKDGLESKLAEIDPSGTLRGFDSDLDVDQILDEADDIMKSTGEHVLLRLRASMESAGSEGFVKELRRVLKSPYLGEGDLIEITNMCRRLGLSEHRRAALEIARQRYPNNEDILLRLAAAYDDSPNVTIKERGRLMLEEHVGIKHGAAGPELTERPRGKPIEAIMVLFDSYFHTGRTDWVLSLCQSAERILGADVRTLRNKARALAALGHQLEAEKEFKRAIELDPTDDTTHAFYSDFLDDEGRYEESYEEHEKAILLDPEDGTRYSNLAIQILNRGLVRDAAGQVTGPISKKERIKCAVPLLLKALEDKERTARLRPHVIGILVRADAVSEAKAIAEGELLPHGYDTNSLDYVERTLASQRDSENHR
jgi:uncharacterized protein (TIGR02996 family)